MTLFYQCSLCHDDVTSVYVTEKGKFACKYCIDPLRRTNIDEAITEARLDKKKRQFDSQPDQIIWYSPKKK